jgi:hypothetical protein
MPVSQLDPAEKFPDCTTKSAARAAAVKTIGSAPAAHRRRTIRCRFISVLLFPSYAVALKVPSITGERSIDKQFRAKIC